MMLQFILFQLQITLGGLLSYEYKMKVNTIHQNFIVSEVISRYQNDIGYSLKCNIDFEERSNHFYYRGNI